MQGIGEKEWRGTIQRNRDKVNAHTDKRIREQNSRNTVMFTMVLDAVKGQGDADEFAALLEEDRRLQAEADAALREDIAEDVIEIIGNLDAIDGAPADEIARAVADELARRLED